MGPGTKRQRMLTHYGVLQVSEDACVEVIEAAYRRLAKIYHPDNKETGNQETFIRIKSAYDTLSDPNSREIYDRALVEDELKSQQPNPEPFDYKPTRSKWQKKAPRETVAQDASNMICQMVQQIGLKIGITNLDQMFRRDIEREIKRYVRNW